MNKKHTHIISRKRNKSSDIPEHSSKMQIRVETCGEEEEEDE